MPKKEGRSIVIRSIQQGPIEWVHVTKVNNRVTETLRKRYRYHPLDLKDIEPPIQRSKVVEREGYIFMILLFPHLDQDSHEIKVAEVDFFISKHRVVTVNSDAFPPIRDLFEETRTHKKKREICLAGGVTQLLYAILNNLVTSIIPKLVQINADMDSLEDRLYDPYQKTLIKEILQIKMNVVNSRMAVQAHKMILRRFLEIAPHYLDMSKLTIYFNELIQNTKEIWDMLELEIEQIDAIHETHKSLIDFRTNDVIKTLTIFSVIVYPLTLIASVYGMNIMLPFENHPYSFWIVILIMIAGGVGMMMFLKYKKWM